MQKVRWYYTTPTARCIKFQYYFSVMAFSFHLSFTLLIYYQVYKFLALRVIPQSSTIEYLLQSTII